jgi:hypothetical protein
MTDRAEQRALLLDVLTQRAVQQSPRLIHPFAALALTYYLGIKGVPTFDHTGAYAGMTWRGWRADDY